MKFYCIGDGDTARGFRLAGVEGSAVSDAAEASAALSLAAGRGDCGVIIMTGAVAALIREQVDEIKMGGATTLIVEI